MNSSWSLRPVRADDAAQVAAHGCYRDDDAARRPGYAAWVCPRIQAGLYVGWFAVQGDAVVGGAGAVLLDWGPTRANPGGQMARIVNVFTVDALRGCGIARELLQAVLRQCEERGVREFNLGATQQARGLYRSLGFEDYAAEMRRRVAT
ncbi:GNAT superfamily N-acetyltransferase [Pelomonas saccharophila]|uniref:GNAT superfamily N-acetyltransferase n=1 Tax=Roseateles saccharophilus TaxID=304 RepID=A0ABU1YQN1_ROSSA|nr:GNAT family N-acetyltransferase [Roseateles saccharophilus]MDR7270515.1 GNAT superfamily N-acetyltransferase [Roseateles saccharophilus]